MQTNSLLRPSLAGLTAGLLLTACGGGGSGSGDFQLLAISVPQNGQWQLNRPIEFRFSKPVNFSSVDSNSLTIRTPQGVAALGEYSVKLDEDGNVDPRTVVFQPRCPLESDFSDSGLAPGGVPYLIEAIGADISIGLSVRSQDDDVLVLTQRRNFTTALGTLPSELFIDTEIGFPLVRIRLQGEEGEDFTHIRLRESGEKRFFERVQGGFEVEAFSADEPDFPINLFSAPSEQFDVVVFFDQAVSPADANISTDRLSLESRPIAGGPWEAIPSEVALEANCTSAGARVRIRPLGVLPQEHEIRVVVSPDFADIVGQQGLLAQDSFGVFRTQVFPSPLGPGDPDPSTIVDEIFETFVAGGTDAGSIEDLAPDFIEPVAAWGGGELRATFDFDGTGGIGGNFDVVIGAGQTLLLSTVTSTINDINGQPQQVQEGFINVDDFTIEAGGRLLLSGTNPARIVATGDVTILGEIDISGTGSGPVPQLNSPNVPQPGAPGQGGGGKGGRGSPLTTTSTPKGENGFGPGDSPNGGGVGGESAVNQTDQAENRRGAGGGGGQLANAYTYPGINSLGRETNGPGTADDVRVNALLGINGSVQATGALGSDVPTAGAFGPARFVDLNPNGSLNDTNDFFGTAVTGTGDIILGELTAPTAGAGGGGGGDSINAGEFPAPEFILTQERKGGAGGGGGGQLQILALGTVTIGDQARILANGGRGGEGESTGGTNQIGGGGGAGSGGHIIIQAGDQIDLSGISTSTFALVRAAGGEGALGFQDGTNDTGATGSGGDGGGGVIQFHVNSFDTDVLLPAGATSAADFLDQISSPNPKLLVPTISSRSRARSLPIPLGTIGGNSPNDVLFAFLGVSPLVTPANPGDPDESGQILTLAGGEVDQAAVDPLLERDGGTVIAPVGTNVELELAAVDAVNRIVEIHLDDDAIVALSDSANGLAYRFDAAGTFIPTDDVTTPVDQTLFFKDDSYLRNAALLRRARLALETGAVGERVFLVESAEFIADDPAAPADGQTLRLFLNATEGSFQGIVTDTPAALAAIDFELKPRSFRVFTNAQADEVPAGQSIRIQAQLLADDDGQPNLDTPLTEFTGDFGKLSEVGPANGAAYVRFDVLFDLGDADGNTPRPRLDFLRLPIRF